MWPSAVTISLTYRGLICTSLCALLSTGCGSNRDQDQPVIDPAAPEGSAAASEADADAVADAQALQGEFLAVEIVNKSLDGMPPGTEPHQSTYPDGKPMAQGFINDEKPIGPWLYWHETGKLALKGTYLFGARQHGEWMSWNEEGVRTSIGTYLEGSQDGDWQYWYDNGRASMAGAYHLGEKHGTWRSWHTTGAKASTGDYIRGKRAGWWDFWGMDGQPLNSVNFNIPTKPYTPVVRLSR